MFRKSTLLAVAASAALGLAMLAPTSASASGHGGGHGGGHGMHGGGHGGGGMHGGHRGGHGGHFGHHSPSPALARSLSPPDLVRRPPGRLHRLRAAHGRRPLHLPEQGIHPGRRGAVQGSLHQRSGDESAGCGAAADRRARAAGAAVQPAVRAAAAADGAE